MLEGMVVKIEMQGKMEQAKAEKASQDLMDTKKQELKSLTTGLDKQEMDSAEKKKQLSNSREQLDDTKADLKADEAFFEETKATCEKRAAEWEQRSKLRDMELQGIRKAVEILTSKEAKKAFKGAAASLVQLSQSQHRAVRLHSRAGVRAALRNRAYEQLRALAATYSNMGTAKIAVQVKSGDAFDKVIMMIDHMIVELRKEEQEDIEHRDRCQNSENQNSNEKDDLAHSEASMKDELGRMEDAHKSLVKHLDSNKQEAQDIEKQMAERLQLRNQEHDEYLRALEADTSAVKIIGMAQTALKDFFAKQEAAKLVQIDEDASRSEGAPPTVSWGKEGGKYGGQKGASQNALGALDMIREDLEKEVATAKSEDDANQQQYEKDVAAMEKALKTKKDTIGAIDRQLAELGVTLEDKKATIAQNAEDASEAEEMTKALATDCKWVKSHFEKRRKARKAEIAGLQEAKDHLAKSREGDEDDELDLDSE